MAVDNRQHPQHFNSMGYNYPQSAGPQFTNPWGSAAPAPGHMYQTSLPQINDYKSNVPSYASNQLSTAPIMASGVYPADPTHLTQSNLQLVQDGMSRPYGSTAAYTSAPAGMSTYAPTSAPQYQTPYGYTDRRTSHP